MTAKPAYLTAAEDAFKAHQDADTLAALEDARMDARADGYDPEPLPGEHTH